MSVFVIVKVLAAFFEQLRRGKVRAKRHICQSLIIGALAATATSLCAEEDELFKMMSTGGYVLLVRHADAPGTGDPPGFRLGDCATQRNLSEEGRAQARSMGAWLRNNGIDRVRLYSSEWCRCLETAELMDLGPVAPLAGLNSFYQRQQDREPNLVRLKEFLAVQPLSANLLVLVTHQVTISALTGEFVAPGMGVLASLGDSGDLTPVRSVDFGR